jgi:uncharacterized protein YecE (DUF72 family)
MTLFPLFDQDDRPPQAERLAPRLRALADQGVFFGTSSWKYEGWLGSIYSRERYLTRGRFSKKKFEEECLAEFVETFPIVCGDFSFYQFPKPEYWARLFGETPMSFLFALKVPEDLTAARWPGHARYGTRAGLENESFLNAEVFRDHFARPLMPYAARVATLIFEFGTFARSTFARPEDFLARLEPFLEALPTEFRYCVEIRNSDYLRPDYLALLASKGVAHVLNGWTRMPEIGAQIELPGVFTTDFSVVRAQLIKGRTFEEGVKLFEPYGLAQEPNEPARDALRQVAEHSRQAGRRAYIFVSNRLEGNSPSTIEAVVEHLKS